MSAKDLVGGGSDTDCFHHLQELSLLLLEAAQKIQRDIHDFGYVIIQRDSGSLFFSSINLSPFSKVSLFS